MTFSKLKLYRELMKEHTRLEKASKSKNRKQRKNQEELCANAATKKEVEDEMSSLKPLIEDWIDAQPVHKYLRDEMKEYFLDNNSSYSSNFIREVQRLFGENLN